MNKNTEVRVKITDEYNIFTFADGNRAVNPAQVKKLIKSIENIGLIPTPIIVNEKLQILDGQHRVEACRQLKMPVYYIVVPGAGMKEATAMNANNKNWLAQDYLNFYASEGVADYVFLKRMVDKSSISLSVIIRVFGGSSTKEFMEGKFRVNSEFGKAQEKLEWMDEFVSDINRLRGRRQSMYYTLGWIKDNVAFDDARLKRVVHDMSYEDIGVADLIDGLRLIEERYNKNLQKKNKVYFEHEYMVGKG